MDLRVGRCWSWVLLLMLVFGTSVLARQKRQSDWWRSYQQAVPHLGSSRQGGVLPVHGFGGPSGGAQFGLSGRYTGGIPRQMPQVGSSPIIVQCGEDSMVISVKRDLYGNGKLVRPSALSLGPQRCQPNTQSTDAVIFQVGLQDCGNVLQMTPDWMIYSTNLAYSPTSSTNVPITRTSSAVIPIHCYYTRHGNVSSKAVRPTWVPFSTTVTYEEKLNFSLTLMADDWSGLRDSTVFQLGDIIYIEASVGIQNHIDMILFVDSCVATITPDPKSSPRYEIINANGCLVDGTQEDSSSAFISPRTSPGSLRFTVDAFRFLDVDVSMIFISCQLRAAAATHVPDDMNKACSYSKATKSWSAVEGPNNICQCCETGSCSAPSDGSRHWGSFGSPRRHWKRDVGPQEKCGQAILGPLLVIGEPSQPSIRTGLTQASSMSSESKPSESKPVQPAILVAVASVSLVLVAALVTLIGKCVLSRLSS